MSDLRTRNRDQNRVDVARVALTLFAERGFDAVTVDDIALAAGISRRTFFRYFESKEDAALPTEHDRLEALREALASRPVGEPLVLGLRHALVSVVETDFDAEEHRARLRIVADSPSVKARSLELLTHWETELREVIADHRGVDATTDVATRVLAAAMVASVRAAAEVWVALGDDRSLADVLAEAHGVLLGDAVAHHLTP